MKNKLKTVSLDAMINNHIGKRGTTKREAFENELKIELSKNGASVPQGTGDMKELKDSVLVLTAY